MMNNEQIKQILATTRSIAAVGLSSDVTKDSFGVVTYLRARGYRITPVNPKSQTILGEMVYRSLTDIPAARKIDLVQIFRPSDEAPGLVSQAILIGARTVWMQEGIVNEEAAATARAAGLEVVMDCCMMQKHRLLFNLPPLG